MNRLSGALASLLFVGACASTSSPGPTSALPTSVLASPPPSAITTYGTDVPTQRGSLPKAFGQHAALTNPGTTDVFLDFILTGTASPKCNTGASPAKNGKFIAVSVTAKTASDPQNLLPQVIFGSGWEYVSATGESIEATTAEAGNCSSDAPAGLKPNRNYNFDVVLDVPRNTVGGVIVFDPARNGGWEWPLP